MWLSENKYGDTNSLTGRNNQRNQLDFFPYVFFAYLQLILELFKEKENTLQLLQAIHTYFCPRASYLQLVFLDIILVLSLISYPHKFMLDKQTQPLNKLAWDKPWGCHWPAMSEVSKSVHPARIQTDCKKLILNVHAKVHWHPASCVSFIDFLFKMFYRYIVWKLDLCMLPKKVSPKNPNLITLE